MKNDSSEQGFTLVEVLVAFAVLSLSLTALYTMIVDTSKRIARADAAQYGLAAADAKLKEISVSRPLHLGEQHGVTDNNYNWQSMISVLNEDEDQNADLALVSIQLSVQPPQAVGKAVSLETRRLVGFDELQP